MQIKTHSAPTQERDVYKRQDFKRRVFLLQQRLVDKPLLAEKEEETIPVASMEARRLTNEIFRKLDSRCV